jgi:hypothetical protein
MKTWRFCKLIARRPWKVRSRHRPCPKGKERKSRTSTGSRKMSPWVTGSRIIGTRTIPRKEPTRCTTCRSRPGNQTPRKPKRSKSLGPPTTANPPTSTTIRRAQIPEPTTPKSLGPPTAANPPAHTTQAAQTTNPENPTTALPATGLISLPNAS